MRESKSRATAPQTKADTPFFHTQKKDEGSFFSRGQRLNGSARSRMEGAFGANFSDVKVHNDSHSSQLAGQLQARAFTVGNHIGFAAGEYEPGTIIGDALLAHELAHVQQQRAGEEHDVQEPEKVRPKLKSGLQIQRCGAAQKPTVKAPPKDTAQSKLIRRFRSEKLESRDARMNEAATRLTAVSKWADEERDKQHLRKDRTGVVGLDPHQMENTQKALGILKDSRPLYDVTGIAGVTAKIADVNKLAKDVKKYIGSSDPENKMLLLHGLSQTGDALDEAEGALEKLRDSVDGYPLYLALEKSREMLEKVKAGTVDRYEGIEYITQQNKSIINQLSQTENDYANKPASIDRIIFVLQYFAALNAPQNAGQPSADEMKKFRGKLTDSLGLDMSIVFGSADGQDFVLFVQFANMLEKQLTVRAGMVKAGLPDDMIPTQKDAAGYFKSLKDRPNDEVIKAYQNFAQAFFFHRIVSNLDDMKVNDAAAIFQRPASITGTRPLVCSGYAVLGASLISQAGGKVEKFISAIRVTDHDVLTDSFPVAHALAQISRKGQRFFVSNDLIFSTEKEGLDVLDNPGNMIIGVAPTNLGSAENLGQKLAEKKAQLQKNKTK